MEDPALALAPGPAFKYVQDDATLSGAEFVFNVHPSSIPWLSFDNSFFLCKRRTKRSTRFHQVFTFYPSCQVQNRVEIDWFERKNN